MVRAARAKRAAGEADIPAWFEKAARQMFEDSSGGSGISMAEMTLVTAAPARHIAAAPKSASSSAATAPASPGGSEQADEQDSAEVQRLAEEVYAEICRLMAVARERNGEPWR
jgi:type IV secretory pathway TrbL component